MDADDDPPSTAAAVSMKLRWSKLAYDISVVPGLTSRDDFREKVLRLTGVPPTRQKLLCPRAWKGPLGDGAAPVLPLLDASASSSKEDDNEKKKKKKKALTVTLIGSADDLPEPPPPRAPDQVHRGRDSRGASRRPGRG